MNDPEDTERRRRDRSLRSRGDCRDGRRDGLSDGTADDGHWTLHNFVS